MRIVIGTTPGLGNYLLPELLSGFQKAYPEVEFAVHMIGGVQAVAELARGAIDIGYVMTSQPHPAIAEEPVADVEMVIVAAPDHDLAKRQHVEPNDLVNVRMVLPVDGSLHRQSIETRLAEAGILHPPVSVELASSEAMKRAV